jgi:hypothetical protein
MLMFRILCSAILAWAAFWALSRPDAAQLRSIVPEMIVLGPLAAAYVGAVSLAVRQGWGFVVALANGVWAGILSIVAAGVLYLALEMARAAGTGGIGSFRSFFVVFADTMDLLLQELAYPELLTLSLAATACAGVLTEAVHWLMVRVRERRQRPN